MKAPHERDSHSHSCLSSAYFARRSGLLDEVTGLLLSRDLLPSHPAGRAIGYRQTLDYLLRPRYAPKDEAALTSYVHSFAAASRRYAQQQTKWFRSEHQFEWVPVDWAAPEAAQVYSDYVPIYDVECVCRLFVCVRFVCVCVRVVCVCVCLCVCLRVRVSANILD